jgi:hypothetical protein
VVLGLLNFEVGCKLEVWSGGVEMMMGYWRWDEGWNWG